MQIPNRTTLKIYKNQNENDMVTHYIIRSVLVWRGVGQNY